MRPPLVIGIGEIVWDHVRGRFYLGGAPYNFAHFAKESGAAAYVVSAVGNDRLGRRAVRNIASDGVETCLIQQKALPTGTVEVDSSVPTDPKYDIVEPVAWDGMELTEPALDIIRKASCVCWGSLAQRSALSRRTILSLVDAAPADCLRVFDINIRQHYYSRRLLAGSLRRADVLKLNENELPLLQALFAWEGDPIEALFARYRRLSLVVYTCGSSHSSIYDRNGLVSRIRTPKVKVRDTVGAGDSFTAVLVTSLLKGCTVPAAHAKAVEVAALVCRSHGAIVSLPETF